MMDKITASVKEQYESYPYPHIPIGALEDYVPITCNFEFVYYYNTHKQLKNKAIHILDAGCGTGFSTYKLAQQNPEAKILAVDLSSTSLEIAQQRLTKAGLIDRVTFQESDLMTFSSDQTFDYISCSGVLHHLKDPEIGLKNISDCLKPEGLMSLLLYSRPARYFIHKVQTILKQLVGETQDFEAGLIACRNLFNDLPSSHPIKADYLKSYEAVKQQLGQEMADSDEFLVDTYLNRCEHSYDLKEIYQFLDSSDLKLIHFVDEMNWDPHIILPTLSPFLNTMSRSEKLFLMDQFRLRENYAFWCGRREHHTEKMTRVLSKDSILTPSPLATIQKHEHQFYLSNRLGAALQLNNYATKAWELIDGKRDLKTIQTEWLKELDFPERQLEMSLMPFINQLIEYYMVLI